MKTLIDWAPFEFSRSFQDTKAFKMKDLRVVEEYSMLNEETWKRWPGNHKNVYSWVLLENGFAVGWNENSGRGWSFPVLKI
jgi:hypothetical protein